MKHFFTFTKNLGAGALVSGLLIGGSPLTGGLARAATPPQPALEAPKTLTSAKAAEKRDNIGWSEAEGHEASQVCRILLQKGTDDEKKQMIKHLGLAYLHSPGLRQDSESDKAAHQRWNQFLETLRQQGVVLQAQKGFLKILETEITEQMTHFQHREAREAPRSLAWLDHRYGLQILDRFHKDWHSQRRARVAFQNRLRHSRKAFVWFLKIWYRLRPPTEYKVMRRAQKQIDSYVYNEEKLRPISIKARLWQQVVNDNVLETQLATDLKQIQGQIARADFFASSPLIETLSEGQTRFNSLYEALSATDFELTDRLKLLTLVVQSVVNPRGGGYCPHPSDQSGPSAQSLTAPLTPAQSDNIISDLWKELLNRDPEGIQKLIWVAQFKMHDWLSREQIAINQQVTQGVQHTYQVEKKIDNIVGSNKAILGKLNEKKLKSKAKIALIVLGGGGTILTLILVFGHGC